MKKIRTLLLVAVCMVATATTLQSHGQQQQHPGNPDISNNIRFIQVENNLLVFEVHLNNAYKTTLSISDDQNNEFYSEVIEPVVFSKRYKINTNDLTKVKFQLYGKRIYLTQLFTVDKQVQEKLIVKRIK